MYLFRRADLSNERWYLQCYVMLVHRMIDVMSLSFVLIFLVEREISSQSISVSISLLASQSIVFRINQYISQINQQVNQSMNKVVRL